MVGVGRTERQDVDGSEACLLSRRHEHDDGLRWRVTHDRVVRRLRHGDDARGIVGNVEALPFITSIYLSIFNSN